jgi:hypothetical protein
MYLSIGFTGMDGVIWQPNASWFEAHKDVKLTKDELETYFEESSNSIGQFKKTRATPKTDLEIGDFYLNSRKTALGTINTVRDKSTSWLLPDTSKVGDKHDNDSHKAFCKGIEMGNKKLEELASIWNAKVIAKVHQVEVPNDANLDLLIETLTTEWEESTRINDSSGTDSDQKIDYMNLPQLELSLMREFMTELELEEELELFKDPQPQFPRTDTSTQRVIANQVDIDTSRSLSQQLRQLEARAAESLAIEGDTTIGQRTRKRKEVENPITPPPKKTKGKKGKK